MFRLGKQAFLIDAGSGEFEYTGTYQKRARREKPLGNRITFNGKYELLDHEEWEKEIESRQQQKEDTSHNQDVDYSTVPRVQPSSSQETSVGSLEVAKPSDQPASTDTELPVSAEPKGVKRQASGEPSGQPSTKKARANEPQTAQGHLITPVASAAK